MKKCRVSITDLAPSPIYSGFMSLHWVYFFHKPLEYILAAHFIHASLIPKTMVLANSNVFSLSGVNYYKSISGGMRVEQSSTSSQYPDAHAWRAVDGDTSVWVYSLTEQTGGAAWWRIYLQQNCFVQKIDALWKTAPSASMGMFGLLGKLKKNVTSCNLFF